MKHLPISPPIQGSRFSLWFTLAAILLSSFMGTWDGAAPIVALPAIVREYQVGIDVAVWVMTASSLLFAVPMAVFGKLGDMLGHRRIYLIGASAYLVFACLAIVAPSFGWLILFRALQGLASAPTFTATMAFIATSFPLEQRGRAMGLLNTVTSLAWASGPVLGGLLMGMFNWRAILAVEIPLGTLALLAAWRLLPDDKRRGQSGFDIVGAATMTLSALVLMFGLHLVSDWGWAGWPALVSAAVFVGLIAAFLFTETHHQTPFLPLRLFANHQFSAATAFSATQMIAMFGMALLVPVYLQEVGGVDPAAAGLTVAGLSIARVIFEPLAGRVAEVRGSRAPSLIGTGLIFLVAAGFALVLSPSTPGWAVFAGMFVFGIGIALGRTPVYVAVTRVVDRQHLGLALGVFSMLTFTGGAFGQSTFALLLRTLAGVVNAPLATAPFPILSRAFAMAFVGILAVAMLVGLFGWFLPGQQAERQSRRLNEIAP